jgi:hypothetical protein
MKEPNWSRCTEKQMWHWVAVHLARADLDCTLVGGAVAAIYSKGAYHSGDLDIVVESFPRPTQKQMDEVFRDMGFSRKGMLYHHPECGHLAVQVLLGSVHVGKDHQIVPSATKVGGVEVKMLSATDIVKDRLASCLYFNAEECFDQAELVARAQTIDWQSVRAWAKAESSDMPAIVRRLQRRLTKPLS